MAAVMEAVVEPAMESPPQTAPLPSLHGPRNPLLDALGRSELRLERLGRGSAGAYLCQANNSVGASQPAQVLVGVQCKTPFCFWSLKKYFVTASERSISSMMKKRLGSKEIRENISQ